MRQPRCAFTLIELLIVVAIIAILAAIAVPNFLEAQTRAKVSRAKTDMRSFATAVEAYRVDYSRYPHYGRIDSAYVIQFPATVNDMADRMAFVSVGITTPIAYLTTRIADVFATSFVGPPEIQQVEFLNLDQHVANFPTPGPPFAAKLIPAWGNWRMVSAGPDRDRGEDIKTNQVYDPTNGTISNGDIVRCQRFGESAINPNAP
jgi:prepilin-type N-terminal cleavage/methylation domain-containing protein